PLPSQPTTLTISPRQAPAPTHLSAPPLNDSPPIFTFSASGLPTGVTASFSPNPSTSSSTLTLTASATATTGTATVTITGVSGSLKHTTSGLLSVNSPTPPNFTRLANPTSVTITQGR